MKKGESIDRLLLVCSVEESGRNSGNQEKASLGNVAMRDLKRDEPILVWRFQAGDSSREKQRSAVALLSRYIRSYNGHSSLQRTKAVQWFRDNPFRCIFDFPYARLLSENHEACTHSALG